MDHTQEIDTNAEQLSSEQKRLFDVLTLIENVCKQETPTPSVEEHKGFVGWESDLRGLPGIVFNLNNEGDPIWMEVRRLVPTPSPARSESLNPWVEKSDDPNKEPKVLSQIVIQVPWSESKAYASKIAAAEDVSLEATGSRTGARLLHLKPRMGRPRLEESYSRKRGGTK